MLTTHLRELEADGMVIRKVYAVADAELGRVLFARNKHQKLVTWLMLCWPV